MKKYCFFLATIFTLIININVFAENKCTNSEMERLKKLAEKIEFKYDYEIKEEKNNDDDFYKYAEFSIKATNLSNELKTLVVYNYYTGNYLEFNESNKGVLKGFTEGEKVNIVIKAYTNNDCVEKTVLTKTINLPYYNELSDSEICQENPNFKYCSILLEQKVSNDTFINELENTFNTEKVEEKDDGELTLSNNSYIIYIVVALFVVFIVLGILFMQKKRRKEEL